MLDWTGEDGWEDPFLGVLEKLGWDTRDLRDLDTQFCIRAMDLYRAQLKSGPAFQRPRVRI
jgi:hypothetical protein